MGQLSWVRLQQLAELFEPRTGRTVLLRIGRHDGDVADNVYGVLGPTQLELTGRHRFGDRFWVQVLDPPS